MESSIYSVIAFYLLAAVILGSAVMIVSMRNIVHAVLFFAACLISLAGLYLLLDAVYLAVIQVLVYAGAVCIMVIFAVMLVRRSNMSESNLFNRQTKLGAGVVALTLAVYGSLAAKTAWSEITAQEPVPDEYMGKIGELLINKYVIPFEVAALLLTVALIGAIVLAKEVKANDSD